MRVFWTEGVLAMRVFGQQAVLRCWVRDHHSARPVDEILPH